jgi:hypothetical protein
MKIIALIISIAAFIAEHPKTAGLLSGLFSSNCSQAQNFMFGTNTSDNTAGVYETNSPTSIHPNRRYQYIVSATEQHNRARKMFWDTLGGKNSVISNARFMWIDQSTGEMKVSRMDSMLKMLRNTLILPYASITGTPTAFTQSVQPVTLALTGQSITAGFNTVVISTQTVAITLAGAGGLTITGSHPNFTVTPTKRLPAPYTGVTDVSGFYIQTFAQAYSVAPNIQANIVAGSNVQLCVPSAVSTTGFTVTAFQRVPVTVLGISLLPGAVTSVIGATVDVLITEK